MRHFFKGWFKDWRQFSAIITAIIATTCNGYAANNNGIHEYTLNNGLKLLIKEDHRAPIVVSMVWYKVGAAYEPGGITGVSHALEHMMFKGTQLYPSGEFSKIIAAHGGEENAFTDSDYTAYYENLATSHLAVGFKLEAARMQHLLFVPDEFSKEIQVVREERRMRTDDSPQGLTYERFMAAANLSNPYHHPVIGWMEDLHNMQLDDVKHWYATWYVPNNATVVVVGDVQPEQVLQLAQQYFATIPSRPVPMLKPQREPHPLGERHLVVKIPAKLPMLIVGYNVPSLLTATHEWVPYALDVLAGVLDGGESSRLPRDLIRDQQLASQIDVDYSIYSKFSTQFTISATPAQQHSISELQQALRNQIHQLQQHPITDAELQRIKNQITAAKIYAQDSAFGQAMQLGLIASIGLPWQTGENYVTKIAAITPQQVQQVAQLYLTTQRSTVAVLQPILQSNTSTTMPQPTAGVPHYEK